MIFLFKNYNYIFEFVKIMTKELSVPFSPDTEKGIFTDVTIASSLRSVVQVLMGHLQFFTHTDCQDDSCQKLSKVLKICQSYGQNTVCPFLGDTV